MEKDDVLSVMTGVEEGLKEQLVAGLSGSSSNNVYGERIQ